MKYKIGDRVKIRSKAWYEGYKIDENDNNLHNYTFTSSMAQYCGRVATIEEIIPNDSYKLDIDNGVYQWFDFMFEERIHNYAYRLKDKDYNKRVMEHLKSVGGINSKDLTGEPNPGFFFTLLIAKEQLILIP